MTSKRPYIVLDDDDDESRSNYGSDMELLDYDSESDLEIIAIEPRKAYVTPPKATANSGKAPSSDAIALPDVRIQRYKLGTGTAIAPGDTVELKDHLTREPNAMHSGDFLRIKFIIKNLQTDEVRLRGYRMRRTKYFGQIFDWKTNELGMVLRLNEHDNRSPFVVGMEDINLQEVLRVRECTLTNKPYPFLSFRTNDRAAWPTSMSKDDIKRQIFHEGRLTCRVVNILNISGSKSKPYGGIVRHLYTHEADVIAQPDYTSDAGLSCETSISVEDMEEDECVVISKTPSGRKRRVRGDDSDFEILDHPQQKQKTKHSLKQSRLVFGDVFCGAGGASQGAAQAGYYIQWGLDNDERALEAYCLNHPSAVALRMNAHDFPPEGTNKKNWRVDVLHLSPPCCYWSPAHTVDGPHDQANYETIYTVGSFLEKVKPRVATLEQTFGLATHEQHKPNFKMLLHDIISAGYNLRYKIQDLSEYGLVQQRKRLLIIAARRGSPLPPFPKPTHGPPGSGLKPFVYIDQALTHITRQGRRAVDDHYHQLKLYPVPKPAYDPRTFLKGCITTSGTTACHPSGERQFTPRELSLFQSFPYIYKFTGTKSEATKQIGNAFPPIMAQALYETIAKTLNVFDEGIIGAEDDLSDLDALLNQNGGNAPQQQRRNQNSFASMNLLSGTLNDNFADRSTAQVSSTINRRHEPTISDKDDEVIYISSDSE